MIGRLSGVLLERNPPQVLVDVHGMGYEVDVPMSTFYNLPANGEKVTLLTHFIVREDGQFLYGFASEAERVAFLFQRYQAITSLLAKCQVPESDKAITGRSAMMRLPGRRLWRRRLHLQRARIPAALSLRRSCGRPPNRQATRERRRRPGGGHPGQQGRC